MGTDTQVQVYLPRNVSRADVSEDEVERVQEELRRLSTAHAGSFGLQKERLGSALEVYIDGPEGSQESSGCFVSAEEMEAMLLSVDPSIEPRLTNPQGGGSPDDTSETEVYDPD